MISGPSPVWLSRKSPAVIANLSARVGSISDNGIGGWYSYRWGSCWQCAVKLYLPEVIISCTCNGQATWCAEESKTSKNDGFVCFCPVMSPRTTTPTRTTPHSRVPTLTMDATGRLDARLPTLLMLFGNAEVICRASKSAQNQLTKTLAVELARRRRGVAVVALHPGTVDTDLSLPFQKVFQVQMYFHVSHSSSMREALVSDAWPLYQCHP